MTGNIKPTPAQSLLRNYRFPDHWLFFSGSVPSTRPSAFSPTWFPSTTWHDTQWRPQPRATTRSLGPWSGSTWEKSSTGSARWNSRWECVWNKMSCVSMIWHFIWFHLTDIKWSDNPFNVTVDSLVRPPVFWSKFVRLCLFVRTGPGEGWRGQDQIWLRPAFGGHAELLPYIGRIGRRLSQPFWFSSLSPPLQNHIPHPHVPQKPVCSPCAPFCDWVCVHVCVCYFMWREKRKMYCIHYYWLPHISVLWILCVVVDRACECGFTVCMNVGSFWPISSFLCLHDSCA